MSDEQKYTIQGLDEYIRQGELQQHERSEAWKVPPKCKIERRTASKVQKLHFRRGGEGLCFEFANGVREAVRLDRHLRKI